MTVGDKLGLSYYTIDEMRRNQRVVQRSGTNGHVNRFLLSTLESAFCETGFDLNNEKRGLI